MIKLIVVGKLKEQYLVNMVEDYKKRINKYHKLEIVEINDDGIEKEGTKILEKLSKKYMCEYDEAGSIGKRYRRQDEVGTPYCITVDFDTLEDNTVTIRDRDTMEQIRININEIENWMKDKFEF